MMHGPRPEMSDEMFRLIRDIIYDHCGIYFRDDMKYYLERRLAPRLQLHGLEEFGAYYRLLRFSGVNGSELEEAIDILTTNETYFFREEYQLRAFSSEILPEIRMRNLESRKIRIWSAGCSTGEEPYSIAVLLLESGLFHDWDVEIFANDISRKVLATARRGVYGKHAFRETEEKRIRRWFISEDDGNYRVRDEIRRLVTFGHLNLLDSRKMGIVASMDVIFCRNVLIYFDSESKKRVLSGFFDRLKPGGYLLLGHSESLLNLSTDYELAHLTGDLVYRRPKG